MAHEEGHPDRLAIVSERCHDRWCQPCASGRARTIAGNLAIHLDHDDARLITLTLRSTTEPLRDLIDRLMESFKHLRRLHCWRSTQRGGAAFIEVTRGARQDRWHVHLHVIAFGSYLPKQRLIEAWHSVTGDSYIVDIRAIGTTETQVDRAIGYVTKYATKGVKVAAIEDDEALDEAILALRGRRLVITYGNLTEWCLTQRQTKVRWVRLASLDDLRKRATQGDIDARIIMNRLNLRSLDDDEEADADLNPQPPPEHSNEEHEEANSITGDRGRNDNQIGGEDE